MRACLLILLLIAGCRCNDVQLQRASKCWLPCYDADPRQAGKGACTYGTWVCNEAGDEESAVCVDQGLPSDEICDGVDNDCNGVVDESPNFHFQSTLKLTRSCSNACGPGSEVCIDGTYRGCDAPQPVLEVCNGLDDDCDGQIDDLPQDLVFCYEGQVLAGGDCRPGVRRCLSGRMVCDGQVLPGIEVCNGLDDDCDGQTDEDLGSGSADIVFVIDNSQSMGIFLASVEAAVDGFSATYGTNQELRWAIVVAPDPDWAYDGLVRLRQNFTDSITFRQALAQMAPTGGGAEPCLDALKDLADPLNPLGLAWRPGARRAAVVFSDEIPQSWRYVPNTPATVNSALSNSPLLTAYVFAGPSYTSAWASALPGGLSSVRVLGDAPTMQTELESIIRVTSCE